ncbi:hypothetical protein [Myroides injenensis]|uniref:hypothetical protein n=1 Tax=Myroides injenensis TaxID=1183151 RepID=UPI0022701ABB|nr:hypothetical protein [Myroides injenensis]
MKKDIEIPEVRNVEIAIVKEYNEDFLSDAWYAYLFNNSDQDIEAVMIVSQGEGEINGEQKKSSLFRHAFPKVAPKEAQKIELLDENIFQLSNTFMLTYFQEGKLFDKNYIFPANTIKTENLLNLPFTDKKGILSK